MGLALLIGLYPWTEGFAAVKEGEPTRVSISSMYFMLESFERRFMFEKTWVAVF